MPCRLKSPTPTSSSPPPPFPTTACAKSRSTRSRRRATRLSLELTRTPDILATVAAGSPRPFVVGFAAETQNVERNALLKLEGKKLDMIAANQVGEGLAFDCDDNALTRVLAGRQARARTRAQVPARR